MPFIPNTPESRLGRSDSLNPETTCRGITSGGRPCRRPLNAVSPGSSPQKTPPPPPPRTRVDRLRVDDDPSNPDLYCWQHKDQAASSARSSPGPGRPSAASRTNKPILESRESMDTLIDRLGIVEAAQRKDHGKNNNNNTNTNNNNYQKSSGQGAVRPSEKQNDVSHHPSSSGRKSKTTTTITRRLFCCCFPIPVYEEEEEVESQRPVRPKPRPVQSAPAATAPTAKLPTSSSSATAAAGGSGRKANSTGQASQNPLSLIPERTAPQTASQLLAEMAKPVSAQDEPGYIYIFWLTPETSAAKPPTDAARSLLAPSAAAGGSGTSSYLRPADATAKRQRRPSDVLASYAADAPAPKPGKQQQQGQGQGKKQNKTILLKIGRASNVHRRLNEWTRQCGYDLDLIRYYPYVPSSYFNNSNANSSPSSRSSSFTSKPAATPAGDGPRKTPHSHKVERLVHIELSGLGLRALGEEACAACGRQHREWFEVEASRGGIRIVDEIVRRWCDWDEGRL